MDTAMLLAVLNEGLHELSKAEQRGADTGKPAMMVEGKPFTAEHIEALSNALRALAVDPSSATWLQVEYVAACTIRGIEP